MGDGSLEAENSIAGIPEIDLELDDPAVEGRHTLCAYELAPPEHALWGTRKVCATPTPDDKGHTPPIGIRTPEIDKGGPAR